MDVLFQTRAYLNYLNRARHRKGFGIHSPYLYHFINDIIQLKYSYYAYSQHIKTYKACLKDQTRVDLPQLGTGKARSTTISKIARSASKKPKDCQLLFRIALESRAKTIFELGTNLGLTTRLLARINTQTQVYTFEGAPALTEWSEKQFKHEDLNNIHLIKGNLDLTLKDTLKKLKIIDFIFIDANHTYEATMNYFNLLVKHIHQKSILVLDDIHQSSGMQQAWQDIQNDSQTICTLDLFRLGIVFFDENLPQTNYIVSY